MDEFRYIFLHERFLRRIRKGDVAAKKHKFQVI